MNKSIWCVAISLFFAIQVDAQIPAREIHLFDDNWAFHLGDVRNGESAGVDDSQWRRVILPHDWDVENRISPKAPMGGGGGFFMGGIGWYRKSFNIPEAWKNRKISITFEGVYMNADVWVNGRHVALQPYGYTTFTLDITREIKLNQNLLAVRVDNSGQKNSRWYSGSGIYRHVWMTVTSPVHIENDGVFFSTKALKQDTASVHVDARLVNEDDSAKTLTVQYTLKAPGGRETLAKTTDIQILAGKTLTVSRDLQIPKPELWSPEHPNRYQLVTRVLSSEKVIDETKIKVGIRTLAWSASHGLTINGKIYKLNGGCVHHDNGVLGAAAFDRAETRKVQLIMASGFNEIRTAHNPPSPALLNACDSLGLLVMDEAFDCWTKGKNSMDYSLFFKDWWQKDLDRFIKRDRNHPSVIIWSTGNEIPGSMDPKIGGTYCQQLVDRIRLNDATRPVTQGLVGLPKNQTDSSVIFQQRNVLDLVGCNYNIGTLIQDEVHHPGRVIVGTESFPDNPFNLWEQVHANPFVVGDNVWTAMDYLGESGIGRWFYEGDPTEPLTAPNANRPVPNPVGHGSDKLFPWHGGLSGDLDLLGFRRPVAHYRNIVWGLGENLFMGVRQPEISDGRKLVKVGWSIYPVWDSWTFPGWEGKLLDVEVYTRYDKIQLYLNDHLLEEKIRSEKDKFKLTFRIPYSEGVLKAVGFKNGLPAETTTLKTAHQAVAIRLTPDRTNILADGEDLSFVTVEVIDQNGELQTNADNQVKFTIAGAGVIQGLGSADLKNENPYTGQVCQLFHGRGLLVIRSQKTTGQITLTAASENLKGNRISIHAQ